MTGPSPSLAELRARLAARPTLWRSLDGLADTPAFRQFLLAEFPAAARLAARPDRRRFLRLMAASFALAGLAGCGDDDPRDQEVPYVRNPERFEPGTPLTYATVAMLDGFANGITVTQRNGRPTKVEGNPEHPWSRGGTDIFAQASVLDLYDPIRSQAVRYLDRGSSWDQARGALLGPFAALRARQGRGLRLLTGPVTSPTLLAGIAALQRDFPEMRWHAYAPAGRAQLYEGAREAFGRPLETRWRFERARVVVSLDGDFLDPGPHQVGVSRDWITARRASAGHALLTTHDVSSVPGLTSAKADHHLAAGPREIAALADALLADASGGAPAASGPGDRLSQWRARAGAALREARGAGIVTAGATQPAPVQAAVHRLNAALGNTGQTVFYTEPAVAEAAPLAELAAAMERGEVDTLLMLGVNPAYDAPGDLDFAARLARVRLKLHAGLYVDETAVRSDWHLPLAHPLEAWGDARSLDGTVGLMQPVIAPLYGGRSMAEILSLLVEQTPRGGQDIVRAHWQGHDDPAAFAPRWEQALRDGFWRGSALPPVEAAPQPAPPPAGRAAGPGGLDVVFRPDPTVWDGGVANNSWLQELPKPLTKLAWENAVGISPRLAERERVAQGDVIAIEAHGRRVEGPAWILPGQADNVVSLTLGYGRVGRDMLADGLGYDAYRLRTAAAPWHLAGATLTHAGARRRLATTQDHGTLEGRDLVRVQREGAPPLGGSAGAEPTLYPPQHGDGRAWGMVIDLDACIGCNACVVACQAENNIPVVGREELLLGRDMFWLRIDRYYSSGPDGAGLDEPDTHFQPMLCQHCEQAPCEVGCPVEATLHDSEGLNLMVYNRCIGTRACSGYCPYKVRRFNYHDYAGGAPLSTQQQRNPEVTVRANGVMEKCTYCVQRIAEARIVSDRTNEPIPDGAVQTSCQVACPTRAIIFGDLAQSDSAVAGARRDPRNYAVLGELNVRPRTTYLAERAPHADKEG